MFGRFLIICGISVPLLAGSLFVQKGHYGVTYDVLTLPRNEKMGLLGTSYLYDFGHAYVGLGIYSAVTGHRGGFFTGGVEGGYKFPITHNLLADVGMFVGGGGGGAAAQGGGLMLRPHLGMLYDMHGYNIGAGVSKVDFPNGQINSNQLYAKLSIPFTEVHKKNTNSPMIINDIETFAKMHHLKMGWSDTYFSLILERYFIPEGTLDTSGKVSKNHLDLVGFEYGKYLHHNFIAFIQAAGAGGGDASGYAQFFGGLGYKQPFSQYFGGYIKTAIGAAGGGKIDTGGGIVHQESVGLYAKLNNKLTLSSELGHIKAFNGNFQATSLMMSVNYTLKSLSVGSSYQPLSSYQSFGDYEVDITLANQTYIGNKRNLNLIGMKIDRYLNNHDYFSAEALSAYSGNAGGYSVGLVGFGRRLQVRNNINLFTTLCAGVGGGGGVDTGSGFIVQPMAGVQYAPTDDFAINASFGDVKAINGGLNDLVVNIGVSYKFKTID